jgi:hypothetical protein
MKIGTFELENNKTTNVTLVRKTHVKVSKYQVLNAMDSIFKTLQKNVSYVPSVLIFSASNFHILFLKKTENN